MLTTAAALTDHTRSIAINGSPAVQKVSSNLMCVEDEDSLAAYCKVHQRSCIENEISIENDGGMGRRPILVLTSSSFHGIIDSWKRFPRNGRPLGPGGSFPLR